MSLVFDGIDVDAVSQNFLEEIAGEMIRLHSVTEVDAVSRIVATWKGKKFRWPTNEAEEAEYNWLIFHESPEHWAQAIFHKNWTWWRPEVEHTIRIKHADWETMGDHSLSGMFVSACLQQKPRVDPGKVTKLTIEVEQTSISYRRVHGPLTMLVPEFMPAGIMRNIQHLLKDDRLQLVIRDVEINPCRIPKCCNWEIR